ncbi:MAG: hypothetical protein LBS08_04115, partial [Candidatus Symbiothrix sp.]|nr:hypothetical protein [Candidatus Symbiothrix sp.]
MLWSIRYLLNNPGKTINIPYMISIIICSKNKDISEQLKSNIEATIGVRYELIVIDNSKQDYS